MSNELTDQEKVIVRAALIGLPASLIVSEATKEEIEELNFTSDTLVSIMKKLKL
jgi:hypothetical protein